MQTDAELLARYAETADQTAFTELARRHGAFVYRVCLRRLGDAQEAEDAAQAAFLVLARRARTVRKSSDLAAWLYGVALRVSGEAVRARMRRRRREEDAAVRRAREESARIPQPEAREALERIDDELARLPVLQRQAVILRYLEGRSQEEAARMAGCPPGTIGRRASDGIARLRQRLATGGCALGTLVLVGVLEAEAKAAVPATLLPSLLAMPKAALAGAAAGAAGPKVAALAEGALKTMFWAKAKVVAAAVAAMMAAAGGAGIGWSELPRGQTERKDALLVRDLTPVKVHPASQHPPVVLVHDGTPLAKVYVAENPPSKNLAILIKELMEVVRLSTGAVLEEVKQIPPGDMATLVIGDCEASRAAGIDASKIPIDGYVVKTAANRVFLVGSTIPLAPGSTKWDYWANEGTAWAVADFLERLVGVRWYWPSEVGGRSVVRTKTLAVGPVHYSDAPVFLKREFHPPRYQKKSGEWRARFYEKDDPVPGDRAIPAGLEAVDMTPVLACLRMGNSWPYTIKVHNPQQIWKNQNLIDQHPDMFSQKKDGKPNFSMLCYSSPKTFKFLIAGCEAVWDKGRTTLPDWQNHGVSWVTSTSVTISPFDMPLDCACEACQASLKDGGPSKHMARFVKKIAEEVQQRWPGKKVMYLPYWNYAKCPEDVEFPENVEIQLCTGPMAGMRDPKERESVEKNIAAWRKKSPDRIQTWEYANGITGWSFAPVQYPHVVKDYYAKNRDLIVGSFINGEFLNEWSKTAPTLYCWMKVLWNPDVDVDAILDVFCERLFGKANKTARELLGMMCDRWENTRFPAFRNTGRPDSKGYARTWPPEVVEKMTRLRDQARHELKDDPVALQRFEYFTWTFEHFVKEAREHQASEAKK